MIRAAFSRALLMVSSRQVASTNFWAWRSALSLSLSGSPPKGTQVTLWTSQRLRILVIQAGLENFRAAKDDRGLPPSFAFLAIFACRDSVLRRASPLISQLPR